jgi:protein Tex
MRRQLLDVSGLGEATFVQAAGFLKIEKGENPLDATWIHPENYPAAERLLAKLGVATTELAEPTSAARIRELVAPLDREALAGELGIGRLALNDMIEAICKPGRDPREDLPPPIFRKDIVKFEQLEAGMELRGTVLNVVDFGAFVDVGLSDSGLIHISQLSAGYVRDPHDVVAVGDQVRAWVASIDKDRRRVALTMIAPGTERPRPAKPQRGPRRRPPAQAAQPQENEAAPAATPRPPRRQDRKPQRERSERRDRRPERPERTGAYEKRAAKTMQPITKAMEEGKEMLRSFGDLLQFHQKKKERVNPPKSEASDAPQAADGAANGEAKGQSQE